MFQINNKKWIFIIFFIFWNSFSIAEEGYSEKLRQEILEKDEASLDEIQGKNFTEKLKEKIKAESESDSEEDAKKNKSENYSEELKSQLTPQESSENYSEEVQKKAIEESPDRLDSAIDALHEGRSELKLKRPGHIQHASGFRVGAQQNKSISAPGQGALFSKVYKDSWNPEVSLFYEYHPFHWDSFLSLGFGLQFGYTYFGGNGQFKYPPLKPNGSRFDAESEETFNFQIFSASVGPTLRLNMLHYFRPFIKVYPGYFFYDETRTFDKRSIKGKSLTLSINGGVGILLDWISQEAAWSMYDNYSIKHYYLTIDYLNVSTLSGKVKFKENSFFGGFTFEF